jgi:hypothetical protein
MGDTVEIRVDIPRDENGMIGRECPNPDCLKYFKLKPGTGLPISETGCPYCGTRKDASHFFTPDQIEYGKSVAIKQVLEPPLRGLKQSVDRMNRRQPRSSLISFEFSVKLPTFRVHQYRESELETHVTCSNCALEFAVFGIFASCPDCGHLNAYDVFQACLEVCRRRLGLLDIPETAGDPDLVKAILTDALSNAVSAFDALGKTLRQAHPTIFPQKPKNLFQNLSALDQALLAAGSGLEARVGADGRGDLARLFQIRHVYEHNLGVVDDDMVAKVPGYAHLKGKICPISREDVERLIELLDKLASSLRADPRVGGTIG